jgi:large conductance mechanosensitive channel
VLKGVREFGRDRGGVRRGRDRALINFLIVASVVSFAVVVTMKTLAERRRNGVEGDTPAPSDETVLLAEIRDLLRAQQR